jgi:WD40 repeat protein
VYAVATLVLPDGRPVAVTGSVDATVRVWDLTSESQIGSELTGHTGPVDAVAALVLPDGRPVAVTGSTDATVRVWDLATGSQVGPELTGHTGPVSSVAALVLPDGRPVAVTTSGDATVRVWDLATGIQTGYSLNVIDAGRAVVATPTNDSLHVTVTGQGLANIIWHPAVRD